MHYCLLLISAGGVVISVGQSERVGDVHSIALDLNMILIMLY